MEDSVVNRVFQLADFEINENQGLPSFHLLLPLRSLCLACSLVTAERYVIISVYQASLIGPTAPGQSCSLFFRSIDARRTSSSNFDGRRSKYFFFFYFSELSMSRVVANAVRSVINEAPYIFSSSKVLLAFEALFVRATLVQSLVLVLTNHTSLRTTKTDV